MTTVEWITSGVCALASAVCGVIAGLWIRDQRRSSDQ